MNVAVWVERHGRRRPDDPAVADGDRVHAGWGAFAARTAAAAAGLRDSFGLSPGDRVAIVMRNRPEYLADVFPRRHAHVRETIEICQGIWTNETFEYHGEFADFEPCGFGHQPVQKPHPPIYFSGLRDPKRSANRVAKYGLAGWIGIQDTPRELTEWRTAIGRELEELGKSVEDLDICSMIWFTITDEPTDQSDNGKISNILIGTADQITDMLKRYKDAGLTMPLLWPPFADVPVSKTLDDLKRLKEEILPKVEAS